MECESENWNSTIVCLLRIHFIIKPIQLTKILTIYNCIMKMVNGTVFLHWDFWFLIAIKLSTFYIHNSVVANSVRRYNDLISKHFFFFSVLFSFESVNDASFIEVIGHELDQITL